MTDDDVLTRSKELRKTLTQDELSVMFHSGLKKLDHLDIGGAEWEKTLNDLDPIWLALDKTRRM